MCRAFVSVPPETPWRDEFRSNAEISFYAESLLQVFLISFRERVPIEAKRVPDKSSKETLDAAGSARYLTIA